MRSDKKRISKKKQSLIEKELEIRLSKGIHQLNKNKGSDMGVFIDELKKKYSRPIVL